MTVGIFNLPRCAAVLGFVPFVFLVFAFQYMTWFTGMAYARLQRRYPGIHSVPDAVHLIYGETGRTIMAAFQLLFSIMLAGNHIILGSYAFHTLGWQCVDWHLHQLLVVLTLLLTRQLMRRGVECCLHSHFLLLLLATLLPPLCQPGFSVSRRGCRCS